MLAQLFTLSLLLAAASAQCGDLGTAGNPATDCQQLKDCGAASGVYYINIPAIKTWGASVAQLYCEQVRGGGGWALVQSYTGGDSTSGPSVLTHWSHTGNSYTNNLTPTWDGGAHTQRFHAHAFNYFAAQTGAQWARMATAYDGGVEMAGSFTVLRFDLGSTLSWDHLARRASGYTSETNCLVMPSPVVVYQDDVFVGRTTRSVTKWEGNVGDNVNRGLAGASDTCGESTANCNTTHPHIDKDCNLIYGRAHTSPRIDDNGNLYTSNGALARHAITYVMSSAAEDGARCFYSCWTHEAGQAGVYEVDFIGYRPGQHGPQPTLTVNNATTVPGLIDVAFDQNVAGLTAGDFVVTGGSATGLQIIDASNYIVEITPDAADSAITVDLPAAAATGVVTGKDNLVATQLAYSADTCTASSTSVGDTTDSEPLLDTAASGISNDVVSVVFTEAQKYSNTQFFFGSSTCGADHFTWEESSTDPSTCLSTWTGTASWADFTANCDLIRTESAIESVDHIIYQANFHVTHTETFDGLRPGDDPITRTLTQYMPFEVRLPTSVTATTSPVRIFAPVVVEAAILEQGVSGTPGGDMTGRVGFLTSVQYPFRLGSVTGVTTPVGVATSDADPSTWVGHGQVGTCNDDSAAPCTQFFEWSFSPATGAICELDGEYNVTLEVECQASQVNDCPLDPNPGSVTLSFTLDTTDFCIELVDDLSVSASLETYLSDDFLVVKHDFIDGQRIYAQAPTQAEVSLSATKVVQVSLVKPDASEIFFLNQGSPALTTEGTQVDLVTVDGAAVGPGQNSLPSFNFLADSELFGIAADQSDFITLKARIELSYDNAGQAKRESRDLEWTVLATTSSGTVATSFAMSGSNAVATQGTGTSASTSPAAAATVAGVNVLFLGAALVVMCTVLVAAVVISRGRAKIDALREQLATKAQA